MIYETKNITLHIIHVKVSSDCPCPRTVPMNVAINGAHCGCERNSWVWSKMFRTHKGIWLTTVHWIKVWYSNSWTCLGQLCIVDHSHHMCPTPCLTSQCMWAKLHGSNVNMFALTMEGSRTNGRIWSILSDFGSLFAISQNSLIPVSHILKNLMKNLKISPFGKIGKCQNLAKYEK
mgnify:CR=1 FL=1